ncbi:MAG: ABC transporter permease [Candidatus Sulfotelmatobacter sp.]|jgi:ABC-2 type transport system permease protein
MNAQSNAESLHAQAIAPTVMQTTRPMYWSIRRELWENRSIYIAPLAVAAVTLFGYLIASIGRALSVTDLAQRRRVLEEPYTFAMGVIMGTAFIVAIFYSLDALHGERRDRSILFWKSLPVSDLTTVLSKASVPLVILPLLAFALTIVTQFIMLLLSTLVLHGGGLSASTLWTQSALLPTAVMLLYHLVTVHILWHAPIYGWLMLVSGWARRAAFLWAVLPPAAICVVEKLAFNTSHFAAFLQYRFTGGPEASTMPGNSPIDPMMMAHLTPGRFLSTPGLWFGLVVAAAFLLAAARQRRYRGPL